MSKTTKAYYFQLGSLQHGIIAEDEMQAIERAISLLQGIKLQLLQKKWIVPQEQGE